MTTAEWVRYNAVVPEDRASYPADWDAGKLLLPVFAGFGRLDDVDREHYLDTIREE